SADHTSLGHLVTTTCTTCSYSSSYYRYDEGCCYCYGHIPSAAKYIYPAHETGRGHYYTSSCNQCGEIIESGYTTLSTCSICTCPHDYVVTTSAAHTAGLGHYRTTVCSKCNDVKTSGYVALPSCCMCRGYHKYIYTVSDEHTVNGHLKTGICSDCNSTVYSYVDLADCCSCIGEHTYGAWSEVSPTHEASGHRKSRYCTKCNTEERVYTTYRPCCICNGHDMQQTSDIGEHTEYGHATVYRCIACGYAKTVYEERFGCALCSNTPKNQDEYILWLAYLGIPGISIGGNYYASFSMYRDYGYIIYGYPSDVSPNPIANGEYQFLGYTYEEDIFTNISYQNTEMGAYSANEWIYADVSGAYESWEKLEPTVQKPYMLDTPLIGHGAVNFTAGDIGISKTRVQSGATWLNTGSIYTYKTNGYYATFKVPAMGKPDVDLNAAFSKETLLFGDTDIYLESTITVHFTIDKPISEIEHIKISVQGGDSVYIEPGSYTGTVNIEVPVQYVMPSKYTVRVLIEIKSIFHDVYITGEYCSVLLSYEKEGAGDPAEAVEVVYESEDSLPYVINYDMVITNVRMTGKWDHWTGNERFLGLEQVVLNISIKGRVTKVEILFSDELKKKIYTDKYGVSYDYLDFFDNYDYLPSDTVIEGLYETGYDHIHTYILPLCASTIGYDDIRIKDPYTVTIKAYNEENCREYIYSLDMTGNIYDLLYVQPVH
ncbi:MAG: hypothetical protein WCY62_11285, partial [Clostridia bacterium]